MLEAAAVPRAEQACSRQKGWEGGSLRGRDTGGVCEASSEPVGYWSQERDGGECRAAGPPEGAQT